jgi:hypothetical protein
MLYRKEQRFFFSDTHKKHKLCGQNVELQNVKQVVHRMATGL